MIDMVRFLAESGVAGSRIGAAVSGGLDSVVLLDLLSQAAACAGCELHVLHFDHALRSDSRNDAEFVRELARERGMPFHIARSAEDLSGANVEERAREARYAFIVATALRESIPAVATAHHANDQAETVIMRLMRGAGTRGLSGIPAIGERKGIRILRPLLRTTRKEIEAFVAERGLYFRKDTTNASPDFLRNRVRLEVMPALIRVFGDGITEILSRTAETLRREDEWIRELVAKESSLWRRNGGRLERERDSLTALMPGHLARILAEILIEADLSFDAALVDRIMGTIRNKGQIQIGDGQFVTVSETTVAIGSPTPFEEPVAGAFSLVADGSTRIPELGIVVELHGVEREECAGFPAVDGALASAYLDSASIDGALFIRTRRPGDRMSPLGMAGTKKLHDILIDDGVPIDRRNRLPLLCDAKGILWVAGIRQDERTRINDQSRRPLRVVLRRLESSDTIPP